MNASSYHPHSLPSHFHFLVPRLVLGSGLGPALVPVLLAIPHPIQFPLEFHSQKNKEAQQLRLGLTIHYRSIHCRWCAPTDRCFVSMAYNTVAAAAVAIAPV